MTELIGDIITALIAAAGLVVAAKMSVRVKETHRQVTVNHHSSKEPTLKDLVESLRAEVRGHMSDPDAHKKEKK